LGVGLQTEGIVQNLWFSGWLIGQGYLAVSGSVKDSRPVTLNAVWDIMEYRNHDEEFEKDVVRWA
jgi:hypothetical protein